MSDTDAPYVELQAIKATMGAVIKEARAISKKKQWQCAKHLGVAVETYSKMERGKRVITAPELYMLMQFLNIPSSAIFPGKERERVQLFHAHDEPDGTFEIVLKVHPAP